MEWGILYVIFALALMFKEELENGTSPHELYLKVTGDEAYQEAIKLISQVISEK